MNKKKFVIYSQFCIRFCFQKTEDDETRKAMIIDLDARCF